MNSRHIMNVNDVKTVRKKFNMDLTDLDTLIANALDPTIRESAAILRNKLAQNQNTAPVLSELEILISSTFDATVRQLAIKLRDRLMQRPMAEILNAIPGNNVNDKAKLCQVSRQTFYNWERGTLPNPEQAERISEITGYSIAEIRGSSAPTPAAPAAPAAPGVS
jgi:hypothetical protein